MRCANEKTEDLNEERRRHSVRSCKYGDGLVSFKEPRFASPVAEFRSHSVSFWGLQRERGKANTAGAAARRNFRVPAVLKALMILLELNLGLFPELAVYGAGAWEAAEGERALSGRHSASN